MLVFTKGVFSGWKVALVLIHESSGEHWADAPGEACPLGYSDDVVTLMGIRNV